jgi:hypothetical protein
MTLALMAILAQIDEAYSEVREIEVGLIALFPAVIAVSAFLIRPGAREEIKRIVPFVVGLITAIFYFIVDAFPGWGPDLIVEIGALVALATKLYEPASAMVKLITHRSLSDTVPTGIVE